MKKIFEHANEQHIRAGVVYFNSVDSILYYDANKTAGNKVTMADLVNMFKKGILVVDDGTGLVRPTTLTVHKTGTVEDYAYVTHTTVGASDKAVATSFYSDGYSG